MKTLPSVSAPSPRLDPGEFFGKLGLYPADVWPILEAFRRGHDQWRVEQQQRIEAHAQRVRDHLRRFSRPLLDLGSSLKSKSRKGKRRAVWCVELMQHFNSMSEAARFVNRKPHNIGRAILGGGRCGEYHWERYDPKRHR